MSKSVSARVLEDVRRFGHPVLPLPDAPQGTEAYSIEYERRRELSARRIDEMADRLCMPRAYLVGVLIKLEDRGVIYPDTGSLREGATT